MKRNLSNLFLSALASTTASLTILSSISPLANAATLNTQSNQAENKQLIAQSCGNTEIRLPNGQSQSWTLGSKWQTCNGYTLVLQKDGNLVLYSPTAVLWATGTVGRGNAIALQRDGNVVLYDSNWKPIWATNTVGNLGAFLALQTDGNLVVYNSSGRPLWATNTVQPVTNPSTFRVSYTSSKRVNPVAKDAVDTWMSKIKSGPQGSPVQNGFTVNIVEQSSGIGYADGTYANSGTATITVYPDFFKLSYGKQKKVIMHELGHVMGFGQQRSSQYMNLVKCASNGANCSLSGNNVTATYGGSVPLQGNFFSNSRPAVRTDGYFHFAEGDSKLARDLMSAATLEDYSENDLKYTIAALKDMGFIFK